MKKKMKNKNFIYTFIYVVIIIIILMLATGCGNRDMWDTNYTYDKAICEIGGQYKEIEIKQWGDYEGEQIQIIGEDGKIYLVSTFNCVLIRE